MSWCALNKNEMLEKISGKYVTKKYTERNTGEEEIEKE